MNDPLAPLLVDGVIDEIVGRLKSGKEADLWLVRQGDEVVAAKVYKERQGRSFRNNAAYKEGRAVRNTRTQRAMERGTRFGKAAAEDAWKTKEADTLHTLHAAGVRVPRPVMFYEGVLLMELVLDTGGRPAPRLVDAHVPREAAAAMYADLRGQMVAMLCCDLVHGDLSPYNVLLGAGGPVVIDFPQVVGAAHNNQAEAFFRRDLENLRRFFGALDPALHAAAGDAAEIWRAYVRRELTPGFVPSGKGGGATGGAHPRHGGPPHGAGAPQGRGHRGERGRGGGRPGREPGPPRREGRQGPEVVFVGRGAAATPAGVPAAHGTAGGAQHPGSVRPAPATHQAAGPVPEQRGRKRRRRRRRRSSGGTPPRDGA